ncbi:MAG: GAP family protein [Candidatus Nanopelagicales bacterium]
MPPALVLLLQVIPLGLGVAVIPTVVAAQLVLLVGGSAGLPRAWALAAGRMVGLLLMSVLGLSWLTSLPTVGSGLPTLWEGVAFTLAGVALLIVAVVTFLWHPSGAKASGAKTSRWRDVMNHGGVGIVFALSLGWLIFTVQVYALYLPALHLITNSSAWYVSRVVCFVVLFALASSTVLLPVLAVTVRGERILPLLNRIHDWVDGHSRQISTVVAALFGVVLLIAGVRELMQVL